MAHLHPRRVLLVGILLTLLPLAAHGQRRTLFDSDAIPRDLVLALLAPDGGSSVLPEVIVGDVPPRFASRLVIPAGSRVLGTMLNYAGATVVLDVSLRVDSLRSLLNATITSHGWKPAERRMQAAGFQPARARYPDAFCVGDTLLGFDLFPLGTGGTLLKYRIDPGGNFRCSPQHEGRFSMMMAVDALQAPRLELPDESDAMATACMNGQRYSSGTSTSSRVSSELSPEAMLEFFGKQLSDSGWKDVVPDSGARELSRQWVKRDSTPLRRLSTTLKITVTIPAGLPRCRELQMETSSGIDR